MNKARWSELREEILYAQLAGLLLRRGGRVGSILGSFKGGEVLL